MKTFEVDVIVDKNREAVVQLPPEIEPGAHHLKIVLDENGLQNGQPLQSRRIGTGALGLPVYHSGGMTKPSTFRREEIYGDDGR